MKPPKAHGGKRPGAGRPPDWLKKKCAALIDKHKLLEYLASVAAGKETEERATKDGPVTIEVCAHDRLHAIEILLDRGFGKAVQAITGEDGGPLTVKVVNYGGKA